MAGYKAHLATGMVIGGISVAGVIMSGIVNPIYIPIIFIAVIAGSFLPDLDSDTGLPVKILFSILGLLGSMIVFLPAQRWIYDRAIKVTNPYHGVLCIYIFYSSANI